MGLMPWPWPMSVPDPASPIHPHGVQGQRSWSRLTHELLWHQLPENSARCLIGGTDVQRGVFANQRSSPAPAALDPVGRRCLEGDISHSSQKVAEQENPLGAPSIMRHTLSSKGGTIRPPKVLGQLCYTCLAVTYAGTAKANPPVGCGRGADTNASWRMSSPSCPGKRNLEKQKEGGKGGRKEDRGAPTVLHSYSL